jgi:hypothetical protein
LRALLILMGVAAVCATAVGPLLRNLPTDKRVAMAIGLVVWGLVLLCIVILVGWMRRRAEQQAGAVRFQLATHSYFFPRAPRLMSYISGGAILTVGLLVCLGTFVGLFLDDKVLQPAFVQNFHLALLPQLLISIVQFGWLIVVGIGCIWWTGRVRVCDHGIVRRREFVAWSRVDRHYWDACYRDVLVVQWGMRPPTEEQLKKLRENWHRHREYPQSGQVALRVPAAEREAVIAFLLAKLTTKSETTAVR